MTTAHDLTARLADLLRREQAAMADFLLALAEFDQSRMWLELGYTSLFYFLHRELGLSKGAAFHRKTAAELLRRFPEVVEPLRDGRLCLSSIVEVARVMTPENRAEVLPRFFHRSAREAKVVSAELCPRADPPRRDVVTPVPGSQGGLTLKLVRTSEPDATPSATPSATPTSTPTGMHIPVAPSPRGGEGQGEGPPPTSVDPLTADLRRLHVTVSRSFLDKLAAARDGMSHVRPNATAEQVLEAALDLLLAKQAKRRGLVERPRRSPPPAKAGHVPAHVRREVWIRDAGRCQWPLASGGICGSTVRLELDHIVARARGGASTAADLRILCRAHNDLAARQTFGDDWMNRFTRGGAEAEEAPA
jgi:hypothetical protein